MPIPTRTLDPHDAPPIPMKFDWGWLDEDPIDETSDPTATVTDISPDTVIPEELTVNNFVVSASLKQITFDVAGGVNGQVSIIEITGQTVAGRPVVGHVKIKWKESASQEVV